MKIKELLGNLQRAQISLLILVNVQFFFNEDSDPEIREEVRQQLGVNQIAYEAKYLGLPTPEGRMKAQRFQPLKERLSKRCADWCEKFLSAGGKEVLIKSVAQAIPTYIMSVFHLPASICDELMRCVRNY